MRLPIWLSTVLLLSFAEGNIRLHHLAHKQPDKIDPRNHYYFEADVSPASQANTSITSANATKTIRGRDSPISTTAGGSLPTTSTGALRCGPDFKCLDGGCCGPNNLCGFGPSYCGTGCQSQCDAKAPCGRDSAGGSQSCGMNLCCSYYGWCGVDANYCTPPPKRGAEGCQVEYSDCRIHQPLQCDPQAASASKRTIAYYQGGNVYGGRQCNIVRPSDLKTDNYTHLYWAFALIDPKSHQIVPSDSRDPALYPSFTALSKTGKLQTWISVGGFDFVTDNPAAWSDMVATPQSRAAFISSAVQFMDKYGFQGIDLDWEYPVDPKRGGQPNDMINLVQLLADMRASFGQKYGISVTLAPDLWYLQHFDAKGLLKYASWLGFMSYDLHGIWDADVPRVGRKVYGHTNINDISRDLVPLWYDLTAADMSRVNFGLALYGRGYTLSDSSCTKADGSCTWIQGNTPGTCTGESGIMSRAEIDQVIKDHHLAPTKLDDGTGFTLMKQITWGDQWVGYDDEDTIAQKTYYASSHCFGGTMAWSIDLGTTFDRADDPGTPSSGDGFPGKAAGDKCRLTDCALQPTCGSDEVQTTVEYDCPVAAPAWSKALCCPKDTPLHDCVWRGDPQPCDLDGGCPDCLNTQCEPGEEFVLDNFWGDDSSKRCPISGSSGPQRSLCCQYTEKSSGSPHALILPPVCDIGLSGSDTTACQEMAESFMIDKEQGSCTNDHPGSNGCTPFNRPGCGIEICGSSQASTWSCGLIGLALQELVSNCTQSTYRVGGHVLLRAVGPNGEDQSIRVLDAAASKRSEERIDPLANLTQTQRLASRDGEGRPGDWGRDDETLPIILSFAGKSGQQNSVNSQDSVDVQKSKLVVLAQTIQGRSKNIEVHSDSGNGKVARLRINLLRAYQVADLLQQTFGRTLLEAIGQAVNDYRNAINNPSTFGVMIYQKPGFDIENLVGTITLQNDDDLQEVDPPPNPNLPCGGADLCGDGLISCDEDYADDFDPDQPPSRRRRSVRPSAEDELYQVLSGATHRLAPRIPTKASGKTRDFDYFCIDANNPNQANQESYTSLTYPSPKDWTKNDPRYQAVYDCEHYNFCSSINIDTYTFPNKPRKYVTEHIFELQTPQKFFKNVAANKLPDGSMGPKPGGVSCDFFDKVVYTASLQNLPYHIPLPPGQTTNEYTPIKRMMINLGSKQNYEGFVFLERNINSIKAQLWQFNNPMAPEKVRKLINDPAQVHKLLVGMRTVFNVFAYLNTKAVNDILISECNAFRQELYLAGDLWRRQQNPDTYIVIFWDKWIATFLDQMGKNAQNWVYTQIYTLRSIWDPLPDSPIRRNVLNSCQIFDGAIASSLRIKRDGLNTSPT